MNKSTHTNLLLILAIAIFVFVIFLGIRKYMQMNEHFYRFGGRDPNPGACQSCCGNIDWYLGPKAYKKYCPDSIPPAFQDARDYYASIQEGFTGADSYAGQKDFLKQDKDCKKENPDWQASYNPTICTKGINYVPNANCKCTDKKGNCAKCFPKLDFDKYQVAVYTNDG